MALSPEMPAPRAPAWRQKAARFWRWWSQELIALVPERFGALGGASRLPRLAIEGDGIVMVEPRPAPGAAPRRALLSPLDRERGRVAVRDLLESAGETRARARLVLGRDQSLLRRVTMPAATEENLEAVLGFEMDRLTPFRADEVYFDYRVVSRDAGAGTLAVLLAVARREVVDPQIERLRELGVSVQGVSPEGGGDAAALDMLPSAQRGERESSGERTLRKALLVAVALLFMAALALPLVRKQQTIRALTPLLQKAHAEAQATDALVQQLERQAADYNFLLARKHGTPPVLAYLEEVTRLLPDNTWVQQLDIKSTAKAREIQVSGESAASSRLIEVLEQSELLRNAAPRGTVTRGSQPGSERFVIAAETEARPLPEPRKVTEIVGGAPAAAPSAPPRAPAKPEAARPPAAPPAAPAPGKPQAPTPAPK